MVATKLDSISTCSKLKVSQVTAIKLNYIVVCAAISSAQPNLGVDRKAPARRPFKRGYWSLDHRPSTQVDDEGRGFSIKPPYASNANE